MKIGKTNNNVNFGMKIIQNDGLEMLINNWQVQRGYSQEKIKGIMDSIKTMADDSYSFEVNDILPKTGKLYYSVCNNSNDAALSGLGDRCSTLKFFILRSVKNLCKDLMKVNNKAGSPKELYDYAGK